jgi:uncharacterized membrane protein
MVFAVLFALIFLLGLSGRKAGARTYLTIVIGALAASIWEYAA